MKATLQLFGLAALLWSCASPPTYEGTARSIGTELLTQMETRKDLRDVRLFIDEFRPCKRTSTGKFVPVSTSMEARHDSGSRRFRHELMGVLAPRMNVLESDSLVLGEGRSRPANVFERAAAIEASAILMGNYAMDGDNMVVMLRVIDVDDRVVLAAAEGLVPHEGTPTDMVMAMPSY